MIPPMPAGEHGVALPKAAEPFIAFVQVLRGNGFAVAPDQTATFIEAVGLLGPRSMRDIHRAARATLAPPVDRFEEFDSLFRLVFLGQSVAAAASNDDDDDELQAFDARDDEQPPLESDDLNEVGEQASGSEVLSARRFDDRDESEPLRRLGRHGAQRLPRRRTLRRRAARHGDVWDLRRTLREAARRDGEVMEIRTRARASRQRRIVLLVDVSGSMKAQTDTTLRFAHALSRVAERLEVFTLGTRLTRVSRALRHRDPERALGNAAALVADWDGGTRLGDALAAFLAIPRFAGFARGALVVVLSDGLERGDTGTLVSAVQRLSRLAWRLDWLTPLAADAAYAPRTEAMMSILPFLDGLENGADARALCDYILDVSASRSPARRRAA